MRVAFGSFGRGNARLAALGNAIEGRNVTAHSKHQRYKSHPLGGRHVPLRKASEANHVARPQTKRPTTQRPSHEGAFGAHLISDVSTTAVRLREERRGAARALSGATSAWRGCSVTEVHRRIETHRLNHNAKRWDRVRATLRMAVRRRSGVRAAFGSTIFWWVHARKFTALGMVRAVAKHGQVSCSLRCIDASAPC